MQKLVTEISWLKLSNLTFHLSCNIITFSDVHQCFSWSGTSPKYWQPAGWCSLSSPFNIVLFAVNTSTLWCWECRQCFLKVSGHSEHQYVFDIRCDVFAYYVMRIAYYVFTYGATMPIPQEGCVHTECTELPNLSHTFCTPAGVSHMGSAHVTPQITEFQVEEGIYCMTWF